MTVTRVTRVITLGQYTHRCLVSCTPIRPKKVIQGVIRVIRVI